MDTAQIDPNLALDLSKATADVYARATEELTAIVARQTAAGTYDPDGWAARKLAELRQLQEQSRAVVDRLAARTPGLIDTAVRTAYNVGAGMPIGTHTRAVDALVREATTRVESTYGQIVRSVVDDYRTVIVRTSTLATTGAYTIDQARRAALQEFATKGITGFTDKAGRKWRLDRYAEMSTRTAVGRAQVAGTLDRLAGDGRDLVIVSDHHGACQVCAPFEGKILSISGSSTGKVEDGNGDQQSIVGTVASAQAAGLQHPNCFPGEVLVSAPPGVDAGYARRYEGPLVVIHTASGDELPVTPNHPILTPEGWVPAGELEVGNRVVRYGAGLGANPVSRPDDQQVPAPIRNVVDALRESAEMAPVSVPVTAEQFHGDGVVNTEVDVVLANRLLELHGRPSAFDRVGDSPLLVRRVRQRSLLAESASLQVLERPLGTTDRIVGRADLTGPLLCRHGRPLASLGVATVSADALLDEPTAHGALTEAESSTYFCLRDSLAGEPDRFVEPRTPAWLSQFGGLGGRARHPRSSQAFLDVRLADVDGGRDLARRFTRLVSADHVVHVDRRDFSGHVYNLQTSDGWYVASGIVVHNCRHSMAAFVPGLSVPPEPRNTPTDGVEARRRRTRADEQVRLDRRLKAARTGKAPKPFESMSGAGGGKPPRRPPIPTPNGDDFRPGAWEAARRIRARVERIEPRVTSAVEAVARTVGGHTARLDTRFKELDSIARKLSLKARSGTVRLGDTKRIDDALRYTIVLEDDDYAAGMRRAVDQLQSAGYTLMGGDQPKWLTTGYRGINVKFTDTSREKFEVQFQTPSSLRASDDTHGWYEEERKATTSEKRKAELRRLTNARYKLVNPPRGIELVDRLAP